MVALGHGRRDRAGTGAPPLHRIGCVVRFDPHKHRRRSIRLAGYDYTQSGAYFITICTQAGECFLGDIVQGAMVTNDAGKMVQSVWDDIPQHYPGVGVDAFVVMPNHMHGIVVLSPTPDQAQGHACALSLGNVVHRFKSLTTARYRRGVSQLGWGPFDRRLWQRNYYERVIRNETEMGRIREYIINNPPRWDEDEHNPANLWGEPPVVALGHGGRDHIHLCGNPRGSPGVWRAGEGGDVGTAPTGQSRPSPRAWRSPAEYVPAERRGRLSPGAGGACPLPGASPSPARRSGLRPSRWRACGRSQGLCGPPLAWPAPLAPVAR